MVYVKGVKGCQVCKKTIKIALNQNMSSATTAAVQVLIEYCSAWGYKPRANGLRKAINSKFGEKVGASINPGRTGSFEVTVTIASETTLVHSKINGNGHINDKSAHNILKYIQEQLKE